MKLSDNMKNVFTMKKNMCTHLDNFSDSSVSWQWVMSHDTKSLLIMMTTGQYLELCVYKYQ